MNDSTNPTRLKAVTIWLEDEVRNFERWPDTSYFDYSYGPDWVVVHQAHGDRLTQTSFPTSEVLRIIGVTEVTPIPAPPAQGVFP